VNNLKSVEYRHCELLSLLKQSQANGLIHVLKDSISLVKKYIGINNSSGFRLLRVGTRRGHTEDTQRVPAAIRMGFTQTLLGLAIRCRASGLWYVLAKTGTELLFVLAIEAGTYPRGLWFPGSDRGYSGNGSQSAAPAF
jgi:hypothetical protein